MRSGDTPCGADQPKESAGLDHLADGDIDCREMSVESVQAKAMVENNGVPRKEHFLRQHDAAALRSVHGGSCNRWKIFAAVRRAGHAVQDAAAAKVVRGLGIVKREMKTALPKTLRSHGGKNLPEMVAFFFRSRNFFGVGFDKLLGNAQPLDGELPGSNRHEHLALRRLSLPEVSGETEGVLADGMLQVNTQDRAMGTLVARVLPKRKRVT